MGHDNSLELERQYYEDYQRLLQREAAGELKPVTVKCRFCGEEYELAASDNHMHNCPEQLEAQRLDAIRSRWVTEQGYRYTGPDRRQRVKERIDSLGISVISPRVFPDGSEKDLPRFAQYCKVNIPCLEVYAGIVKVLVPAQSSIPAGHRRGDVYGSSDRSLRRLGERVQKVRHWKDVLFTSTTYPDEWPDDSQVWKKNYEALFKRLGRKWPEVGEIWRLEPQKRGAPHFHAFLMSVAPGPEGHLPLVKRQIYHDFLSDRDFRDKAETYVTALRIQIAEAVDRGWWTKKADLEEVLKNVKHWRSDWLHAFRIWYAYAWHEVIGCEDINHLWFGTDIEEVKNRRQAQYYISKYMREGDEDYWQGQHTGRVWGVRGNVNCEMAYRVYLTFLGLDRLRDEVARYLERLKTRKASEYAEKLRDGWMGFSIYGVGDIENPDVLDGWIDKAFPEERQ